MLIDFLLAVVGRGLRAIPVYTFESTGFEIDPDKLWNVIINLVTIGTQWAKQNEIKIEVIGISVQRNTGTLFERKSGNHLYNFVTWQG